MRSNKMREIFGWDRDEDVDVDLYDTKNGGMMLPSLVPTATEGSPDDLFSSQIYLSSNCGEPLVHRQKKKMYRRKRDGPGRPANSFILFRKHFMGEYHGPHLSAGEMSKRASEAWHGLCDVQHAVWKAKADEEKANHAKKHPDYRYRPKKRHRPLKKDDGCSKLPAGRDNKLGAEGRRSSLSTSSMPPMNKAGQHVFSQSEQTNDPTSSAEYSMARPPSRRMFTADDALWTPALAPVNISRSRLAYSTPPSSDKNSPSPGGNQTSEADISQWFEYDILDGQSVPDLSSSPSTNASSLFDSDASDPNFVLFWNDLAPNVSHFSRQGTFIPELQYPSDPSPHLSPLAAVASMWNATSGVSEAEAALQPSTGTHTTSAQDPLSDLHEILARFILERDLELGTSPDQISAPTETWDASDSNRWEAMSKQATEEIPGAYDLEHEHAQHAFNFPGLNGMQFYRDDPGMYPSDGSCLLGQTDTDS